MANDYNVNWQDYFGLNQGAYQQQAQNLLSPLDAQDAQTRQDVAGSARGAYQRGVMGQPGEDWQYRRVFGGGDDPGELMSYGDAVEKLQNPGTLQAALEGSGHRSVSALDAAGVQQAGGQDFRKASDRFQNTNAYAQQTTERAANDYRRGQADEVRMAQQRADAQAAAQRAADAEKERRANWQKTLEAQEAGRGTLASVNWGGNNVQFDPNNQQRADERNLGRLFSGTMSEGNASDRLRDLYHRARNPLARYGVKGNY